SSYDDPPARLALAAEREPPEREPRDPLELAAISGLGRGHEGSRASRLHFDEHVTGAIAAHEVDLSESRASVARDDGHSAARELCLGHALAGHAEHDARMHSSKEDRKSTRLNSSH